MARSESLALTLNPAALEGMLDLLRGELHELAAHGDAEGVAHAHHQCERVLTLLRTFAGEVETVLMDLLPPGGVDVDGKHYTTEEKRKAATWERNKVVTRVILEAGNPDEAINNLLSILPKSVAWVKGEPDKGGLRGLGWNPDEYWSKGEVVGHALKVTETKP